MDHDGLNPDQTPSADASVGEASGLTGAARAALLPAVFGITAAIIIALVAIVAVWDKAGAGSGGAGPSFIAAPRWKATSAPTATAHVEVAGVAVAPAVAPTDGVTMPTETPAPFVAESEGSGTDGSSAAQDDPPAPSPTPAPPVEIEAPPPGTRDKRLWPFAADSIWNMPIGNDAVYVQAGIAPASSLSIDEEYLVFPSPSDPLRPFFTNGVWGAGRCATKTFRYSINLPDAFQVGDAKGRLTPNAVAAILAADGRTLKQMNPVSRCDPGGPLTAGWIAPDQDIYGPGILGAHGGSGLSSIGGSIRKGELTSDDPVRHVLKVNLWGRRWLSQSSGGHRWPAVAADSFFDNPDNPEAYAGQLPQLRMGALLALPPDVDIPSLGLATPAGRKLAWTLQNYGAYVVDDTTWDSHALDVESGVAAEFRDAYGYGIEASSGPWYQDMMRIFGLLAVVDNNGPDSIGGGGVPRQWLAPPIGN